MEEAEDDLDEDQAASADQKVTPAALPVWRFPAMCPSMKKAVRVVEARFPGDGRSICIGRLCHNCPGAAECDGQHDRRVTACVSLGETMERLPHCSIFPWNRRCPHANIPLLISLPSLVLRSAH